MYRSQNLLKKGGVSVEGRKPSDGTMALSHGSTSTIKYRYAAINR
jgi:hypothetical protein